MRGRGLQPRAALRAAGALSQPRFPGGGSTSSWPNGSHAASSQIQRCSRGWPTGGVARPLRPPAAFSSHAGSCGPAGPNPESMLQDGLLGAGPERRCTSTSGPAPATRSPTSSRGPGRGREHCSYEPDPDNLTKLRRSVDLLRDPRVDRPGRAQRATAGALSRSPPVGAVSLEWPRPEPWRSR